MKKPYLILSCVVFFVGISVIYYNQVREARNLKRVSFLKTIYWEIQAYEDGGGSTSSYDFLQSRLLSREREWLKDDVKKSVREGRLAVFPIDRADNEGILARWNIRQGVIDKRRVIELSRKGAVRVFDTP